MNIHLYELTMHLCIVTNVSTLLVLILMVGGMLLTSVVVPIIPVSALNDDHLPPGRAINNFCQHVIMEGINAQRSPLAPFC
jgi:hypothetical protein